MLGCKEAERRAGGEGVLSSRACLTTSAVVSRKTASMFGWFRTTSIVTNPSGVPIFNFSSCLLTEAAFSIPKICPPALCTACAYLLSASAKLVMSLNLPIRVESREGPPCFHGRRHFLNGHHHPLAAPWLHASIGNLFGQISRRAREAGLSPPRPWPGKPLFVAAQSFPNEVLGVAVRCCPPEGHTATRPVAECKRYGLFWKI
jgi:hypothetical protein